MKLPIPTYRKEVMLNGQLGRDLTMTTSNLPTKIPLGA